MDLYFHKKLSDCLKNLAQVNSNNTESTFFLKEYFVELTHGLYLFACKFSLESYSSELFAKFELDFPPELQTSVKKRQAEFLAGRYSARQVLTGSGIFFNRKVPDVLIGSHRSPIWPEGTSGAITHSTRIAAAIVSKDENMKYLGVDIEEFLTDDKLNGISQIIVNPQELAYLSGIDHRLNELITLAFSAKESLFKALYKKVKIYFNFNEATVERVCLTTGTVYLNLKQEFALTHQLTRQYSCHFQFHNNLVFTLIAST